MALRGVSSTQSGLVGLFYTALSDSKFLVLGAPSESRASSSLNLMYVVRFPPWRPHEHRLSDPGSIEPTEKNPQHPKPPIRGYFDPRRVTSVNQVVAETTYHVAIPHASVANATPADKSSSKIEPGPGLLHLPPNFGTFGGNFGPGPVIPPFGGPGTVSLPPRETGVKPETLPGNGAFGVGPVITPGETIGQSKPSNDHK